MIPEGQSFPFPPLPFQMKKNYQCKKMKCTIATSLLNYTERKVCKKTRANLKLNYPLPSHWTLLSIQKKEERTKTKKNQEKTPQLTLSLQRHLLKWRQERKDQKEGFLIPLTNRTKQSDHPCPSPSSVNRWKSIAQEWTISIQGCKERRKVNQTIGIFWWSPSERTVRFFVASSA